MSNQANPLLDTSTSLPSITTRSRSLTRWFKPSKTYEWNAIKGVGSSGTERCRVVQGSEAYLTFRLQKTSLSLISLSTFSYGVGRAVAEKAAANAKATICKRFIFVDGGNLRGFDNLRTQSPYLLPLYIIFVAGAEVSGIFRLTTVRSVSEAYVCPLSMQ